MKAYIFTALVFASSAALADDARILAKCEGDNGITAALRYDPVPDPTYDNDRIILETIQGGKKVDIDTYAILEAGEKLAFSRYGDQYIVIDTASLRAKMAIDDRVVDLRCTLEEKELKAILDFPFEGSEANENCVDLKTAQARLSEGFDRMTKNGISGGAVGDGKLIGREDCAVLQLHVVNSSDLRQAKSVYGTRYQGIPIQYEITGKFIFQ